MFTIPPVYPVTDKEIAGKASHLAVLKELVRGGARFVQVRDKNTPLRALIPDLLRCAEFAARFEVTLIINDRCDLALICGASGVHLGQEDMPPLPARSLLGPDSIIGLSTHTLSQVRRANELPVQYIGVGPVYPTATKQDPSPVVGLEGLRRICRRSARPVAAIGGIGPGRIREVLEAGAASAAIISGLMAAPNIARRMEQLLKEGFEIRDSRFGIQ